MFFYGPRCSNNEPVAPRSHVLHSTTQRQRKREFIANDVVRCSMMCVGNAGFDIDRRCRVFYVETR